MMSLAGILVALTGIGFGGYLFVRRLFIGPEVEGVFTLFAILLARLFFAERLSGRRIISGLVIAAGALCLE